jgi:hypothetical protein
MAEMRNTPVAEQLGQLVWFHQAVSNALLGVHINARYRLCLDGRVVAEGDHPLQMTVTPITILPGEHELAAEIMPSRPGGWFSLCFRTHATNVFSDASWEATASKPAAWPASGAEGDWKPVVVGDWILPRMQWWNCVPNVFVNMQSGRQIVMPRENWDRPPPAPTYLRKRFMIPPSDKSVPLNPR